MIYTGLVLVLWMGARVRMLQHTLETPVLWSSLPCIKWQTNAASRLLQGHTGEHHCGVPLRRPGRSTDDQRRGGRMTSARLDLTMYSQLGTTELNSRVGTRGHRVLNKSPWTSRWRTGTQGSTSRQGHGPYLPRCSHVPTCSSFNACP